MMIECIEKIENYSPKDMRMLYHSKCDSNNIQTFLNGAKGYDFDQVLNPPCTLKYLLRIIDEPLLTYRLYYNFIGAVKRSGEFIVPIALINNIA